MTLEMGLESSPGGPGGRDSVQPVKVASQLYMHMSKTSGALNS